jgi:toxin FitB
MLWLADTSIAVPLVMESHIDHRAVTEWVGEREVGLTSHSALETYSVLTRLPGDARLELADASELIQDRFKRVEKLDDVVSSDLIATLAASGIGGGAVYDALIGLTAKSAKATLLTRDRRASATYEALGTQHETMR